MTTEVPSRLSSMKRRKQPARHLRVDVAGRLVGEQQLRLVDDGAGDGRALLLAAGEHVRVGVHAVAKPHPLQQIGHVLLVVRHPLAGNPQRHGHIVPGGHVVEQAEILEDDADAAAQLRAPRRRHAADVLAQHMDLAPRRQDRHEQQAQQRRLAGARWTREKVEGAGTQMKGHVAQHLMPAAVFQRDAVQSDHALSGPPDRVNTRTLMRKLGETINRSGLWRTDGANSAGLQVLCCARRACPSETASPARSS